MQVYQIYGHTGSYEDAKQWLVATYSTEQERNKHLAALQKLITAHNMQMTESINYSVGRELEDKLRKHLDPNASVDMTVMYVGAMTFVEEKFNA